MRRPIFLILVLASGVAAGLINGGATLVLVEPHLDRAIEIENNNLFMSGAAVDGPEFRLEYNEYRTWQKSGMMLGGVILGVASASLFGIVYALSVGSLPGRSGPVKGLVLAGIMFAVLYLPSFLKYPPTLPGEGNPETLALRTVLVLVLMVALGFGAVAFHRLYRRIPNYKLLVLAGYVGFALAITMALPAGPDDVSNTPDVWEFRAMSAVTAAIFWTSLGIILGMLWHRYVPVAQPTVSSS